MASSPRERIAKDVERAYQLFAEKGYYHFCTEGNYLDGKIRLLLENLTKWPRKISSFPAVDLESDYGVLTSGLALRYGHPSFPVSLEWCPTNANVDRTKAGLEFLAQEAEAPEILFHDEDRKPVHLNECVRLQNLTSGTFNDREGKVVGADPKHEGRYAVRLYDGNKCLEPAHKAISVKRQNIYSYPSMLFESAMRQHIKSTSGPSGVSKIYQGLIERTRSVDVDDEETWTNLQDLYGKCALVTSLNIAKATDDFQRSEWVKTVVLGSKLLAESGYLVMFGKFEMNGLSEGYGNLAAMEQCTLPHVHRMGMIIDEIMEQKYVEDLDVCLVMTLWKKVPPDYDRIGEMQRVRFEEINWHPTLYWHSGAWHLTAETEELMDDKEDQKEVDLPGLD